MKIGFRLLEHFNYQNKYTSVYYTEKCAIFLQETKYTYTPSEERLRNNREK